MIKWLRKKLKKWRKKEEPKRPSFENCKSNMCHRVKNMGDIDFMIDILETDLITTLYNRGWYAECLYTLGMLYYLS